MAESFDAYHEWLGIVPRDQPPHHYRLLAIEVYEENANVIDGAVDQRMAHLRTFQTGPRAKLCQDLLNKLSAARVTLLDPDKKAAYDAELKEKLNAKNGKSKRRVARALPLDEPLATATPLDAPAMGTPIEAAVSGPQVRSDSSRHRGCRKKGPPWVALGIGGALLPVVAIVAMMAMSGGDELVAQRPKKRTPKKTVDQSVKSPASDTVVGDEPSVSKTSVEAPKKKPAPSAKVPDYLAPTDVAKSKEKPANPFEVAPIDDRPPTKFDPTPERNQPPKTVEPPPKADPAPAEATPVALPKVPTDDALKKADVEIREVFDFKAATDLESRKRLVAEIRSAALETKTDPVGQYAMLRTARDLSAHLGDYAAAEQTINEMSERFDIDPLAMRSKAIVRAMTAKVSSEQRGKVARAGLALAKEFHKADRYKEALAVVTAVGRTASRVKDKQLVADAKQLAIESRAMAKQYVSVRRAMETLKTNPDDPAANTSVGKYLCFVKGEWERGLPMLAKGGDDPLLKSLAVKELKEPASPSEQVALGDGWWKMAETQPDSLSHTVRDRAVLWYEKALPQLSGIAKVKVTKRLESLQERESLPVRKRKEEWISKDATYVLSSIFPLYKDDTLSPYFLTGTGKLYGRSTHAHAFHTNNDDNEFVIIDLGKNKTITKIYIQNIQSTRYIARADTLTVWLALRKTDFGKPVWQAKQGQREWYIKLRPTKARYVKIGLRRKEYLHLTHVKIIGY